MAVSLLCNEGYGLASSCCRIRLYNVRRAAVIVDGPGCIHACPHLFAHVEMLVSFNNTCHPAPVLSLVSCQVYYTQSVLRYIVHIHGIDYCHAHAFSSVLLRVGVRIFPYHNVTRDMTFLLFFLFSKKNDKPVTLDCIKLCFVPH